MIKATTPHIWGPYKGSKSTPHAFSSLGPPVGEGHFLLPPSWCNFQPPLPFTCLPPFASFGDCWQKTRSIGDSQNKFLKLGGLPPAPCGSPVEHHQFMQFIFVTSEPQQFTLFFFRRNLYFLLHTRLIEIFLTSQIYQVYFCHYRASPIHLVIFAGRYTFCFIPD